MTNSLYFLFWKYCYFTFFKNAFTGYRILGCQIFSPFQYVSGKKKVFLLSYPNNQRRRFLWLNEGQGWEAFSAHTKPAISSAADSSWVSSSSTLTLYPPVHPWHYLEIASDPTGWRLSPARLPSPFRHHLQVWASRTSDWLASSYGFHGCIFGVS